MKDPSYYEALLDAELVELVPSKMPEAGGPGKGAEFRV